MATARDWQREARLLLTVGELDYGGLGAGLGDVVAIDFLLQHPFALVRYAELSSTPWPPSALPRTQETESSEETLLRWKRSVAVEVITPWLGRLIGRGLLTQTAARTFRMTALGSVTRDRLDQALVEDFGKRLKLLAKDFSADSERARKRLSRAIDGVAA